MANVKIPPTKARSVPTLDPKGPVHIVLTFADFDSAIAFTESTRLSENKRGALFKVDSLDAENLRRHIRKGTNIMVLKEEGSRSQSMEAWTKTNGKGWK